MLKKYNIKETKQRLFLLEILKNNDTLQTAQIILQMKERFPSISNETIYKNIYLFEEKNIISSINFNHKESYYLEENCAHRAYCRICQKIFKFDFCPLENISREIKGKIVSHKLFVTIECEQCLAKG